jgi:hypothetical protein
MEPINYLANIPNPAGAVFQGLAAGTQQQANEQKMAQSAAQESRAAEMQPFTVQGAQLGLDAGRQGMAVQADQNARANELQPLQVQAQQQQNAQRQQEQQRAMGFQSATAELAALGSDMTIADMQAIVTQYPEYGQAVVGSFQALGEAQRDSVKGVMAQAAFAFKNGNIATANDLIDEYVDAAEASGNAQAAATARAIQQTADLDINAAMAALGLALQAIDPDTAKLIFDAGTEEPSEVRALRIRADEADLVRGTPEYRRFMLNAGSEPATFRALDLQAKAADFAPGTPEYANFMATRGAGAQSFARVEGENLADLETGRAAAREVALGSGEGSAQASSSAAASSELREMERTMPGLITVVDQLYDLSNTATYTQAGVLRDRARAQLGLAASEGAVARAEYIAIVDNQVLPLLRQTFGAAFTAKEGETLRATLGDANKTPEEKRAVLRAFIAQKERDLASRRDPAATPAPTQAPAPATTGGGILFLRGGQ